LTEPEKQPSIDKQRLPLWRLLAGLVVFCGLAADLSLLAPVYYRNYELERYIIGRLHANDAQVLPEERLRNDLIFKAKALQLPVIPNDVHIERGNGVTTLKTFYKIQVDLGLYTVDLHFRPEASSR
jgi:hypothetical protein